MGLEPEAHAVRIHVPYIVGNAFMATVPEHPYFKELIDAVFYDNTKAGTYTDSVELILNTTGPFLTTRIYDNSKYQERITLIPQIIAPITHSDIKKIMNEETSMSIESKVENHLRYIIFFGSWHEQTKELT